MAVTEWGFATIAVLVGSTVGIGVTLGAEVIRRRSERRVRWEERLFDLAKEFAGAARRFRHHAERLSRDSDVNRSRRMDNVEVAHSIIRSTGEQLRLVGNADVQRAARMVQREAWSVWRTAIDMKDPHPEEENRRDPGEPPRDPTARLNDELRLFYVAVRRQLGIVDPDDVIHDDPSRWNASAVAFPRAPAPKLVRKLTTSD